MLEFSNMSNTIDYYNKNAENFIQNTQNVDMHLAQTRFLQRLPEHASILDFGCGSGRDTKYFLNQGFQVTATDGSAELCRLASDFTGTTVRQMLFQELDEVEQYDGIWACSSILHLSKVELLPVFRRMYTALKPNGVIYTSFKYGDFEGERNGRFFTDFTEDTFKEFLAAVPKIELNQGAPEEGQEDSFVIHHGVPGKAPCDLFLIENSWITCDVRPGRGEERWLNLILRKI